MLRLSKGATLLQLACARHVTWRSTWVTLQPLASRCAHSTAAPPAEVDDSTIYDSVVKIYSTSLRPNFWQPWQLRGQNESSGSGFAISGDLILTNAHVVADNAFATVRRQGSAQRYRTAVKAIAHELDLALLEVPDPAFWREPSPMRPLPLGGIPHLQEDVVVVGYPQGGSNLCVTQGVVSRVGMTPYAHAGTSLLAVQIDAAINPGNSGGPALKDGRVVGVAFQDLEGGENIGYIIPAPIISHFLSEVQREGRYRGTCALGLRCQPLESPAARRALGMGEGLTGVLVVSVLPIGPAAGQVLPGDVLLSFDGVPIANDGTTLFRRRERISFEHLVTLKVPGDSATLRLLRGGQVLEVEVRPAPLSSPVPTHLHEARPSYYIYGGLVFTPLSQPYLQEWGSEDEGQGDWQSKCPQALYHLAMHAEAREPGEQVVVLSQVLADDCNFGYSRMENLQLLEVDGTPVRNMEHLVELLEGKGSKGAPGAASSEIKPDSAGGSSSSSSRDSNSDSGSGSSNSGGGSSSGGGRDNNSSSGGGGSSSSSGAGSAGRQFVRFTLERQQVVILDRAEAAGALQRILDTHAIPAHCSKDLLRSCSAVQASAP